MTTWAGVTMLAGFALFLCAGYADATTIEALKQKLETAAEGKTTAGLYSELGTLLYKEGRMEEAVVAFEKSLDQDTSRAQRRHIYLYLGKSYESSDRLDKAISAYENAVLYDKNNWRRHRDLAGLYERADLLWKAKDGYERAVDLAPMEPAVFLAMGRIWRKIGLYSYALPWLKKALEFDFEPEAVQEELSFVYEGQGQFDEAASACAASPDDGKRLVYLAALAGNPALAKEGLDRMERMGGSRETRQAYANLIELLRSSPTDLLDGKTSDASLRAVLKNQYPED